MLKSETRTCVAVGVLGFFLICLSAVGAVAQSPSPLLGDWRAVDGSATARVAPCRGGEGLCATVIQERFVPDEPSVLGRVIVRNLVPGRNGWTGMYVDGGQRLNARVKLLNDRTLELRVCVNAFLCDTGLYARVRP
ncbi:DUF2147 domain-containing protein [Brevundimonas sp.]|uniref:DUF2147 domain-containing protein n=1 Tax=Brevundimonas sp. TaxID=1871086 RepID=UPI0026277847|nr:DUF2147 domain-containing protein [Brevundimonas sp.]